MLYVCIDYPISVNMYHVSAQGIDERMINVHYYYYYYYRPPLTAFACSTVSRPCGNSFGENGSHLYIF